MSALDFNPADPSQRDDPFPVLARLRAEDPVHWSPRLKAWVVTRYDDVRRIASGPALSPDRLRPFYEALPQPEQQKIQTLIRYLALWMVFRDPPEHTRLRRLMNRSFAVGTIAQLEPAVQRLVNRLLARIETGDGHWDLVADFAYPLPALVIMELLGVPEEALDEVKVWSDAIALFLGSARIADDKYARAEAGAVAMAEYFRRLVAERRARPADDLLTQLIQARDEDGALTDDELIASAILFLFAGHETTTNLMANGLYHMLRLEHPWQRLVADPEGLAESAVEEALRYDGPSYGLARVVRTDHSLGGRELRAGQRVFAMLTAANRDPDQFPQAETMDLARTPNRHLTFGHGLHFCLGAPLARLEGRLAFTSLARRFPGLRLDAPDAQPEWSDSIIIRGIKGARLAL